MLYFPSWTNYSKVDILVMVSLIHEGWRVMLLLKRNMLDHVSFFKSIYFIVSIFMLF